MGSPARRAIAFDDHDGDMVFSPRRLITPRRRPFTPRQQLTSRYVEVTDQYYAAAAAAADNVTSKPIFLKNTFFLFYF